MLHTADHIKYQIQYCTDTYLVEVTVEGPTLTLLLLQYCFTTTLLRLYYHIMLNRYLFAKGNVRGDPRLLYYYFTATLLLHYIV